MTNQTPETTKEDEKKPIPEIHKAPGTEAPESKPKDDSKHSDK